jgi:outer membrane usher protein
MFTAAFAGVAPSPGNAQPAQVVPAPGAAIAALSISINGVPEPGVAYVVKDAAGLLIDSATLARLAITYRDSDLVTFDGGRYVPLRSIRGVSGSISEREQRLDLVVEADVMPASRLQYGLPAPQLPQAPNWGGFLNYSLFGYTGANSQFLRSSSSYVSGAFEGVVFGPMGTLGTSFVANPKGNVPGSREDVVLLEANWRWDDPANLRTLIVGDAITAPGWWGSAVRFGGIQYSSNFALQPGYVTFPLLTVSGMATVPTAADIYTNNVRMGTQNVPAGPFTITNLPALNGAGELQVVVTNALGQQQVISQPFYVTSQLLKPGLSEFSYSLGSVRFNYGVRNLDYQGYIGSAFYRHGVDDKLTVQGRAEADRNVRGVGIGADYVVGLFGVLSTGVAASDASGNAIGNTGTGQRYLLGFSRQTQVLSFAVQSTWASRNYREIGDTTLLQTRATRASIGAQLPGDFGSVTLAWGGTNYRDNGPIDPNLPPRDGPLNVYAASYSLSLGRYGFFTLSASRTRGLSESSQIAALYSLPLGSTTSAGDTSITLGVRRQHQDDQTTTVGTFDLQHPLPVGQGYGYYLHATTDHTFTGGASYYGRYGRYTLEGSSANGANAIRSSISGGIGTVGGQLFAAPPIEQSFALVEVGNVFGVRVLQENMDAGRTGSNGTLILPRIPSYTPVNISVDPLSIPLDATIGKTEQKVVLLGRTGVVVSFEARKERNALIRLILPDGSPLPAGAYALVSGRSERFPVARGGEVYITELGDNQSITVSYRGEACEVSIALEKNSPPVADLGPFVCALHQVPGAKQ